MARRDVFCFVFPVGFGCLLIFFLSRNSSNSSTFFGHVQGLREFCLDLDVLAVISFFVPESNGLVPVGRSKNHAVAMICFLPRKSWGKSDFVIVFWKVMGKLNSDFLFWKRRHGNIAMECGPDTSLLFLLKLIVFLLGGFVSSSRANPLEIYWTLGGACNFIKRIIWKRAFFQLHGENNSPLKIGRAQKITQFPNHHFLGATRVSGWKWWIHDREQLSWIISPISGTYPTYL